jgi:hypothetical protein
MYCKNKSKFKKQERRSLEKELNVKLAKRDSMNAEDKNLNDHINLLELKLEKIYHTSLLSIWLFSLFSICLSIKWLIKV